MERLHKSSVVALLLVFGLLLAGSMQAFAAEKAGLKGWGKDSKYNKYYDVDEFDHFKGHVVKIETITPLPGMAPGVGLVVRDQDGDLVNVQVGPKSFVNLDSIGLKEGDKVKIKGAWATINGKDVFMASKIKRDDLQLKVRLTSDGTPFWTMSPERLAKERASD